MNSAFTGTYFDGNSSRPYSAQVMLDPGQVRITYLVPDQAVPLTVYWQPFRIQKELFADQDTITLCYGDYPIQRLEVSSPGFKEAFAKQYSPIPYHKPPVIISENKIPRWLWVAALILLVLVFGFYFWGLPRLADRVARIIPQATDEYLGKQLHQQITKSATIEPELTREVRGFMRQLRINSAYKLHVTVIKENNPNAFALPGGYLMVHSGILNRMQKPEELAALLGHEAGHIQNRHTTRALFRSLGSYLFISLILGDVSGITSVVIQNADMLKQLEYSRKLEQEADEFGFNVLRQNRINPKGMVMLFQRLKQEEKNSGNEAPDEFLSTHPPLTARMNQIKKMIKQQPYTSQMPDSLNYYWHRIKQSK
ncbi:M48 family metallopeptidase [Adhaeribacter radiodurans]|uniref:M48 family metallopeptidase n=1 Tax=Adhaeribacter radiodurans TaxID=2745197 RepID=A0A7L7L960_9BACT|nr:M48 family metallopeptidase [Adhaeribacter radiodurans]QMU28929.1 M48 family metallopeptidase [Adhaeribacter radiodurans]